MSLLTVIQAVAVSLGLPVPQAVVASTDSQTLQLLQIANEEGKELSKTYPWQNITKESTFLTVGAESQGSILTVAGTDFNYIINETIWNRSLRRPVFGPLNNQQWQQMKASNITGPWNQFRIRQNLIIFLPVPAVGQTCAFEWISKNWVSDSTGATFFPAWHADSDIGMLDEDLMTLGIIWRWRQIKGYEYAEDFAKYERQKADAQARDGSKPRLSVGDGGLDIYPGVIVPAGNWMVP